MKKIGTKLILFFVTTVLLIAAIAAYSVYESRLSLGDSIGSSFTFSADTLLREIQETIFLKMELIELITENPAVQREVAMSNREFAGLRDVERYMDKIEEEWKAPEKKRGSGFKDKLLESGLSLELRRQLIDFFVEKYGATTFAEVFVTNRYGAVIALTDKVPDYRQDDEVWFQAARMNGYHIGEVTLDEISGAIAVPLSVRIEDEAGEFMGVVRAVLASNEIFSKPIITTRKYEAYETTQIRVLTDEGRMIYGTKTFRFLEDVSDSPAFRSIADNTGYFVSEEGGKRVLFSYVRSESYAGFEMPAWVLVVSHDVDEVLAPAFRLEREIVLASLALILVAAGLAVFISRSISRPVTRVSDAVAEIAQGNLGVTLQVRSKDEIGSLAKSFISMNDSLKAITDVAKRIASGDLTAEVMMRSDRDQLGRALGEMLENLRNQVLEIREAVNKLASSLSQIFVSTQQLSSGAAESAASITQTTTTVEEVKQTALISSDKAKSVSETAENSVKSVQEGLRSSKKVIERMNYIGVQMQAIAENIVNLSKQSMEIGSVTSTVNDIAEQSNVLAVNASIEAIKAGEQGRGFGVVAEEIRRLAVQSKDATRQVGRILNDAQKAINTAVLAAEEGAKAVDVGIIQSREASDTIQILSQNIERAADAARQIAASSQQQLVGMDQVALAMESIEEAGRSNVGSTKQLEQTAQDLREFSQRLKHMVERYRIEE